MNRKPKRNCSYGGGNLFVTAMCDALTAAGHELVHTHDDNVDRILMIDPRPGDTGVGINEIAMIKHFSPSMIVVHRVNECDARKGTQGMDDILRACSMVSTKTVFVSEWIRDYFNEGIGGGWSCDNQYVVRNGVNRDHFRPGERLPQPPIRIVAHHWSDNPMKGQDVYEWLDTFCHENPDFAFTYIGRTKANLQHSSMMSPIHGKTLGNALSWYHVYVSGSRYDPGPNHVLEALACGLPTYVRSGGGGCVEFAGDDHTFDTMEDLRDILLSKRYERNVYEPTGWDECVAQYMEIMEL